MEYTILMREGSNWRQYLVVGDGVVFIMHMVPALFGWNFGMIDRQGSADWPNMDRAAIVAWKMRNDDGLTQIADHDTDFRYSDFRQRLVSRATQQS